MTDVCKAHRGEHESNSIEYFVEVSDKVCVVPSMVVLLLWLWCAVDHQLVRSDDHLPR